MSIRKLAWLVVDVLAASWILVARRRPPRTRLELLRIIVPPNKEGPC